MSDQQYYRILLDDYSAASFTSFDKAYFGTMSDLEGWIKAIEVEKSQGGTWREMITKETFVKALQLIQEQQEINHQFAKALDLVGDGHYVFGVNNKFYDAAMLVLKEAVNDKYDYISWWLYEGEPDYKVWSSDNTEEWNLTEPEALYDFIVNECQE